MEILMFVLWFVFTCAWIWGLNFLASRRGSKHPPGPPPLPLIGNLHLLGNQPHKSLAKLAKTHGPVMTLKLGQINTVVISSSTIAKEVLQKQDLAFSSRSIPDALRAHNHFQYSTVYLPVDSRWRTLRRIMNSYIFSASRLDAYQQLRSRKVQELVAFCQKNSQSGEAVDIGRAVSRTFLNLLSNILFSQDLTDPSTDSAKEFTELVSDILKLPARPNLVDFFPVLNKFDPQGVRRRMTIYLGKIFEMFQGLISERLDSKNPGSASRDVLNDLLTLSKESPEEIDRDLMEHLFLDIFIAGTDTTSSTLEWAMAELLKNPWTLKKAQAELAEEIGRGKQIEEADVTHLPYLQCVVKETFRMHPTIPFLLPRRVERDVEACGYVVPGGSQVIVNAWAIGRDETIWENASVFKPERFFETEIDFRGRHFELIPFGAGRRICPGMSLASRSIPAILGSLINMFDWKLEGSLAPEELDMEEKFGMTLQKARPLRAVPLAF